MKIVEISCPSCGAKLNLQSSSRVVTCEYCGNQFLVEEEKVQHITNYNIPVRVYQDPSKKQRDNQGMMTVVAATAFVFVFVLLISAGFRMLGSPGDDTAYYGTPSYADTFQDETQEKGASPGSELYDAMTEEMFGKTGDVSQEELARVKYLKVLTSRETDLVWYSFDDPYGEAPDIRTAAFPALEWDERDLGKFTGLVRVELDSGMPDDLDLSGLPQLRGIIADGMEISRIAGMVADPGQITELGLSHIDSMDGISDFVSLERLSIEDMPDKNLKQLVTLKNLKELSLEDTVSSDSMISGADTPRVTDYSAISVMTGLESLSIESDIIKDLGFLRGLPNLTSLSLEDTSVVSLEPLEELTGLKSLRLVDNDEIADYSPVGRMAGLTELTVDKLTSSEDVDLSGLTSLEKLEISGFMSVSGIRGLKSVRELSIHNCNVDGADALSTLTGVERLTFYSVWNSSSYYIQTLDFLEGMTNLKYADFNGNLGGEDNWLGIGNCIEVYGDVSSIFNHPGLEELYMNSGTFEIRFDRINENPTLRVLSLNDADLKENFHVEAYGGIVDSWYDDVALSEHLDFLGKFPNLERLSLNSNGLTDLEFTRNLKKLTTLSVKDNYITDLSPLAQAEYLTYLNISENPAGEWKGADDDLVVIQ